MKNPSITKQDSFEQDAMTLRDYFDAKAMQRLLSEIDSERVIREHEDFILRQVTEASYKVADAMLTEREKNQEL